METKIPALNLAILITIGMVLSGCASSIDDRVIRSSEDIPKGRSLVMVSGSGTMPKKPIDKLFDAVLPFGRANEKGIRLSFESESEDKFYSTQFFKGETGVFSVPPGRYIWTGGKLVPGETIANIVIPLFLKPPRRVTRYVFDVSDLAP